MVRFQVVKAMQQTNLNKQTKSFPEKLFSSPPDVEIRLFTRAGFLYTVTSASSGRRD